MRTLPSGWMGRGSGAGGWCGAVGLSLFLALASARAQSGPGPSNRIAVVVHFGVYSAIQANLNQYLTDLERAGFSPVVSQYTSGTPAQVRAYLAGLYAEPEGLSGAVLIGRIPYITYELNSALAGYESFPCDQYYMDLDGTWSDSLNAPPVLPNNGKYDTHTGNRELEIWVSRLKAENLALVGSETANLNRYLIKDHRYRTGALAPDLKLLILIDDPFVPFYDISYVQIAEGLYGPGHIDVIMDPAQTTPTYVKETLMAQSYEFVLGATHGTATSQDLYRCDTFDECWNGTPTYEGKLANTDYASRDPRWMFMVMGACNSCNYTVSNNLCGSIVFNDHDSGLLTIGSTKVGAAVGDESRLVDLLDQSHPLGEAFMVSLNNILADPAYDGIADAYFGGVVLIGDGSLQIRMQLGDYDQDGIPNNIELSHACESVEVPDGAADPDGDGLSNLGEYQAGTDPCLADSDGDGLADGVEVNVLHTNPLSRDSDGDLIPDRFEADNGGHAGGGLDPNNALDAGADFDGDGNSNADEYYNASDPWSPDPAPGPHENPGCYFWGDADGDGIPAPADVAMLRLEIGGIAQAYPGILPHGFEALDLDRDGIAAPADKALLEEMVAGAERLGGYPSQAGSLEVTSQPATTIAAGATTHVTVSVHSQSGDVGFAPGFGVVFTVVSGNALLLGGDGTADGEAAGNRYDISMEAASGAKANMVVLVTGSGPITIGAKIPGCGTAPFGRWNDEVDLAAGVVINGN